MKKYIEIFLKKRSALDILPFFQSAHKVGKEITESMGCLHAALQYTDLKPSDEDVDVLVIGDGGCTRTGATFAFNTAWNVVSIDPHLNMPLFHSLLNDFLKKEGKNIARLWGGVWTMEEFTKSNLHDNISLLPHSQLLIVRPHSHCEYKEMMENLHYFPHKKMTLVDLPCCISLPSFFLGEQIVKKGGLTFYKDMEIWSPKNDMYVYRNFEKIIDPYLSSL